VAIRRRLQGFGYKTMSGKVSVVSTGVDGLAELRKDPGGAGRARALTDPRPKDKGMSVFFEVRHRRRQPAHTEVPD
jgi:hypothetical protein